MMARMEIAIHVFPRAALYGADRGKWDDMAYGV
jgi:hypothetical protein